MIDRGDSHIGDPGLDLSIAFSHLPERPRPEFAESYGPIDDATWDRSRWRGLHHGIILTHHGRQIDEAALTAIGERALTAIRG